MTTAINLDGRHPGGAPSASRIFNAGFTGGRLLSHPDNWDYAEHQLKANDLGIMGIITVESGGYILPQAHILQVGNEADDPQPAADHMTSTAYVDNWWGPYTETYGYLDLMWVTAGFDSGNPLYWDRVINRIVQKSYRLPDAVMVHPYAKNPAEAAELIDSYWNVTSSIPVGVSEWFRPWNLQEIWPFQDMLAGEEGRASFWNSWYCWSRDMNPGFGLVDHDNNPTQEGLQLVSALGGHF